MGFFFKVSPGNEWARRLADRHYSRKRPGKGNWWPPAKTLCLLTSTLPPCLFAWQYPIASYRRDGQTGYNCIIFRNESVLLSSMLILEAEQWAIREWGPNRAYTYVDASKVKSSNPGYCFLKAGWKRIGISKSGKVLLEKYLTAPANRALENGQ